MTLQTMITERLTKANAKEIALLMGYTRQEKLTHRVNDIVNSGYLGLDQGGYDYLYSTADFISSLCEHLAIPPGLYLTVIKEVEQRLATNRQPKPYLFLETFFKPASQPIFSLAAMQHHRFLSVEKVVGTVDLNEQLVPLKAFIQSHYQKTPALPLWGEIKQYVYFYETDKIFVFSTTGELIKSFSEYNYSYAVVI